MLGIIGLVRAQLLRTRELYANARAASWGARRGLLRNLGHAAASETRRRGGAWRLHPTARERIAAIEDPQRLFQRSWVIPFATGFLLALIMTGLVIAYLPVTLLLLEQIRWLRLDEEIRSIDEALRQSDFRQHFQIEQQWAVRISDLQGLLLRHRPDIVHFSGHGSPASSLILEDVNGKPREVPAEALADLFGVLNDTVRCVVLNACYSQAQAAAIARHVDAVIGMADAMGDQASTSFAAAFYQALGYGKDVPTAFKLGVSQIKLYGLADSAVPQLLMQKSSSRR